MDRKKSSDRGKDIKTKSKAKETIGFTSKQWFEMTTLDTSRDLLLKEGMHNTPIEEVLNKTREGPQYQQIYGGEGSHLQQQKEITVLSDSEEDRKKLPEQKQPSGSRSRRGEKGRSDQTQKDAPPNKRQRIDVDANQHPLHEQQQSKRKELDAMEAHDKADPHDELEKLNKKIDQEKGRQEQIKKRIEEKRKEIEVIEKNYLNIKLSGLKEEALMLLRIDKKDIDAVTELSKKNQQTTRISRKHSTIATSL